MMEERNERRGMNSFLLFLAGGFVGGWIALLYAPFSGEEARRYLKMQSEKARRKAQNLTEGTKDTLNRLISEIREAVDKTIEEGVELTKEKKAELLAAIEAGKKAMEGERKRLEKLHTERSE